ncbi:MAG: nucleoside-diphosphate-sugar epimerase [Gammaproteobacteria bacterium]|jgi:nucleoside-diphosphate-sugar epimerase
MTTLVVGASGATGRLLVEQLLERGQHVKAVVRSTRDLPENLLSHKKLSVIQASVLNLDDEQLVEHVSDCDALASCLGHNMTFKGIFGAPRRLVTDATRRLCAAVQANNPKVPVKFVLMNSTGCVNRDLNEEISFAQKCVIRLLRVLLPPHVDNEKAVAFLRSEMGQDNGSIEWAAVRPDGLIDANEVSGYTVHLSPTRSAIFNAGQTSRINVGHFMAELVTNDNTWKEWKGAMPVIYNNELR